MPKYKTLEGSLSVENLQRIGRSEFKGTENAAVKNINQDIWKAIGKMLEDELSKLGSSPNGRIDLTGTIKFHVSGDVFPDGAQEQHAGGIEFKLP